VLVQHVSRPPELLERPAIEVPVLGEAEWLSCPDSPTVPTPNGWSWDCPVWTVVHAAVREGGGERLLILLNHNAEPRTVALPVPMRVEVGSQRGAVADAVLLAPLDVAVLRQIEGYEAAP
jgi:hypothetical protein